MFALKNSILATLLYTSLDTLIVIYVYVWVKILLGNFFLYAASCKKYLRSKMGTLYSNKLDIYSTSIPLRLPLETLCFDLEFRGSGMAVKYFFTRDGV